MEKGKTSRTAEAAAAQRAIHQSFDDGPKILVDPIAPKIVDVDGDPYKFAVAARDLPNMKLLRSNMVLQSRYAEDCLAEAVQRRVRQYLILGAGLDTFAYRQPPWGRSLHIFEVDHPLTQESKKERLAAAAISAPANLTFAPIDFQSVSLSDGLRAYGFDSQQRRSAHGWAFCPCARASDSRKSASTASNSRTPSAAHLLRLP